MIGQQSPTGASLRISEASNRRGPGQTNRSQSALPPSSGPSSASPSADGAPGAVGRSSGRHMCRFSCPRRSDFSIAASTTSGLSINRNGLRALADCDMANFPVAELTALSATLSVTSSVSQSAERQRACPMTSDTKRQAPISVLPPTGLPGARVRRPWRGRLQTADGRRAASCRPRASTAAPPFRGGRIEPPA